MKKAGMLILALGMPVLLMGKETADTTLNVGDRQIVMSESNTVEVTVSVYDTDGTEMKKTYEGRYSDQQESERFFVSSPFIPRKQHFSPVTPAFWGAFSGLTGGAMEFGSPHGVPTNDSKSWEWGIGLMEAAGQWSTRHTFGYVAAVQLLNMHLHFSDDRYMNRTAEGDVTFTQSEERLKKSYLSYWAFNVPLMLQWQWKTGNTKATLSIGPAIDFKFGAHSRYKQGGHKHTVADDVHMNTVGINLQAYASISGVMLYFRKSITPLLNTDRAPKCYPWALGIGFTL